jgi:NlpC/P60 family putative phage cell wall peptidase
MDKRAAAIIATARTYVGTPFQHQGRLKGVALDCAGLIVGVAQELELFTHTNIAYARQPDGHSLLVELRGWLDEIPVGEHIPGDVLVFWFLRNVRWPQHLGIETDVGLLHTCQHTGRVVEHGLDERWRKRLCHAFRFRS